MLPLDSIWSQRMLSVLRIMAALLFLQHGMSKYLGFPGPVPTGFAMLSLAGLGGAIELVGGILLTLGLLTRLAAFIMSGEMAFAYFMAHAPRGFFPYLNMGEAAILYCFIFLFIAVAGGGAWTLDRLLPKP
jgi:putative oxidoreductase